jgi:hypothetical protein
MNNKPKKILIEMTLFFSEIEGNFSFQISFPFFESKQNITPMRYINKNNT